MFDEVHPVAPRLCRVSPSFANFFFFCQPPSLDVRFLCALPSCCNEFSGRGGGGGSPSVRRRSKGGHLSNGSIVVSPGERREQRKRMRSAERGEKKIDSLSHISHRNAVNPVKPDDILNGNVKNNSVKTYKIPQNTSVRDQTPLKLLLQSSITSVDTLSHCKVNEYTFKARLT